MKKKKANSDQPYVMGSSFLQDLQILADKHLRDMEKTKPIWETRSIPIAHSVLNEFYCWVKKNYP